MNPNRNEIIDNLFLRGFSYGKIIGTLQYHHGITLSKRQLNRILRRQNLCRRYQKTSLNDFQLFICKEIRNTSGTNFGYRLMHQKLKRNGYVVDREKVCSSISVIDP